MSQPFVLGVNYWPRRKAMYWWSDFDAAEVRDEFALIADIGMNVVRLFLLWDDWQPLPDVVSAACLKNLETVCDIAAEYGLGLDVTFFTGHMSGPNWAPGWLLDEKASPPAHYFKQLVSGGEIVTGIMPFSTRSRSMPERKTRTRKSATTAEMVEPGVLNFVKMHGLGNDYVYVDLFANPELPCEAADLARRVSDRHFGIGSDGLILVGPADDADVRMTMFNADGSEGAMCGNGIRCVAKLAYEAGHVRTPRITVGTRSGVKTLELITADGCVEAVRVNMGAPRLAPKDIPIQMPGDRVVGIPFMVKDRRFEVTCVSMGNPHTVAFVADVADLDLAKYGPAMEHHAMFPDRVNAHFVQVHGRGEVTMRTWERGSGVTLACGTGASAVCVAGVLNKLTDRQIIAHLPGGDLELNWDARTDEVIMTGPATEVFRGQWQVR